uniref:Protein MIX23 n=1 Tax=Ditylenchus dipsaci TaxID=166011 RepID=A0A915DMN2_9BILA
MGTPDVDCKNLIEFQRLLNKLRLSEDKILFKLNCDLPTTSFKVKKSSVDAICNDIQEKLAAARKLRTDLIYRCIRENQSVVNDFKDHKERCKLREAHSNLRLLRNEYDVEGIITNQTDKVVYERCRKEAI